MIATNVRNARLNLGLRQAQAAERIGITKAALSRIENAKSVPNITTAQRIADAYGISLAQLVDPDHAKPNGAFAKAES
jgi:transcriptional regulator with XRE-family HTH domain